MSKIPLPSIEDELAPAPRQRVDLKSLKTREPMTDAALEANSRAIGEKWGASTQLASQPSPPDKAIAAPLAGVRFYVPLYLDDELALKAAQRRVTKTFLVMEALEKAGYRVEPADLVQDRRKGKPKGS